MAGTASLETARCGGRGRGGGGGGGGGGAGLQTVAMAIALTDDVSKGVTPAAEGGGAPAGGAALLLCRSRPASRKNGTRGQGEGRRWLVRDR